MKLFLFIVFTSITSITLHAAKYDVSSNVEDIQIFLPFPNPDGTYTDLLDNDLNNFEGKGYIEDIIFNGWVEDKNDDGIIDSGGNVNFSGKIIMSAIGADIRLTFTLSGQYIQDGINDGVKMDQGTIIIDGYNPIPPPGDWGPSGLPNIDAEENPVPFQMSSNNGQLFQATKGLVFDSVSPDMKYTFDLPGKWDGVINGTNYEDAVAGTELIGGFPAGIWMEGNVELTPVPISATVWLFGMALIGLASIQYKTKKNNIA